MAKIRDYFAGDGWNKVNKTRLFLLGNLGLFVIVAVFWLAPVFTSWLDARDFIRLQERTHDNYTRQALAYNDLDIALLENPNRRVLPYEYLTAAMADIRSLALYYGLDVTHFDAAEPVGRDADIESGHFVELRVTAAFSGARGAEFIDGLAETPAFIRVLGMEFLDEETKALRVEFSLFGRRD